MWPNFRCKKAERERDLADEANRLFKQEFGDKIESLQEEVEQLRRQRYWDVLIDVMLHLLVNQYIEFHL